MSIFDLMRKLFFWLDKFTGWAGITFMMVMIIAIFAQVIFRYLLGSALIWAEEVGRYAFCWMAFLGMCIAMSKGSHLRMDFLPMFLSPHKRRMLNLLAWLATDIFCFISVFLSRDMLTKVMESGQSAVTFNFPIWIMWCGILLCFALMALQASRYIWIEFHSPTK